MPAEPADTVELYLVKHAPTVGPTAGEPADESRGLSPEGRADADRIGHYLAEIGLRPDVIMASTRPRAAQTAARIAQHLGVGVRLEPGLATACGPAALERMLVDAGDPARAILVGHIYCFGPLVVELTGALAEPLRDGAVARIDAPRPLGSPATLRWLPALGASTMGMPATDRDSG